LEPPFDPARELIQALKSIDLLGIPWFRLIRRAPEDR